MRKRNTFVYAVAGDKHAASVNVSIRFLKRFSRSDIVVLRSRSSARIEHDQVHDIAVPAEFDDHQASIDIKTSLHALVGGMDRLCCYIDSDVVAVSEAVDDIFRERRGSVMFAQDHIVVDVFSRHAVHCGCDSGRCAHLRQAIHSKFDIDVSDGDWRHWNGGVFLFDESSSEFMDLWHELTLLAFEDPYWRTRDQGTLIATVWKLGAQHQATLPRAFNTIVDPLWGIPSARRAAASPKDYAVHTGYSLTGEGCKPVPAMLHLINGGLGKTGWRNWDELSQRLG